MTLITTFTEKRREKQLKYERAVLRDISLKDLKQKVKYYFGSTQITSTMLLNTGIEEACYDVAIESYLLGANYSRFGVYGEDIEQIKERCKEEDKHLKDTLYHFFLYWGSEEVKRNESLLYLCEQFIDDWWLEGYNKSAKRRKLKLH